MLRYKFFQQSLSLPLLIIAACFTVNCRNRTNVPTFSDCLAEHKFYVQLDYLEAFLAGKEKDLNYNRASVIHFLEQLTPIESESTGNPVGKGRPTKIEVEKWRNWFAKNSQYIGITPTCDTIYYVKGDTIRRVKIYFDPEVGRDDI